MIQTLIAAMLSFVGSGLVPGNAPREAIDVPVPGISSYVDLWTSGELLTRGQRVNVWIRTAQDAFVTVLRIDTDGRVRILFPLRPWHNNYVPAGQRFEVRDPACDDERCAFVVDDYPGKGYVFAIASEEQFDYDDLVRGDYWNYRGIAFYGRVTGDPFVAVSRLMDRIVPSSDDHVYSYDVSPYEVENHYEYPRFLCYDCHSYARFPAWNPYEQSCVRFRLLIHDDPAYSPARTYVDTRAVFTEPQTIEPRYVFTNRRPEEAFVTTVSRRSTTRTAAPRRTVGASARDFGGVGRVAAPLGRRVFDNTSRSRRVAASGTDLSGDRRSVLRTDSVATRPQPRLQRRTPTRLPDTLQTSGENAVRRTLPATRNRTTRPVVPQALKLTRGPATVTSRPATSVKPTTQAGRRSTKPDSIPERDRRLLHRPEEKRPG